MEGVFSKYDKDGNGRLDAAEMLAMLKEIGHSDKQAEEMMKNMDEDGDGEVSKKEFEVMHATGLLGKTDVDVKATFDMFDKDKSGDVTTAELESFFHGMDAEKLKAMVSQVDKNGDGKINFQEWAQAMANQRKDKAGK